MPTDLITEQLRALVGAGHVLTDPDLRAPYERDWTGRWQGECVAVVRPADAAQVAAVVRACARTGTAIVPQGGNTGLVGGSVPRGPDPQILLATTRLAALGEVEPATAQVTVGAGVTLATLQRAARAAGCDCGLDLAARDSATVGGLAACDAGGLRALRHGTARRRIVSLEAVLADGATVGRTSGLVKDNAGYDLGALLIGSEGTLGVITAVRWSLIERREARAVALVALRSVAEAISLARALRPTLPSLEVCELMTETGVRLVLAHLGIERPPLAVTAAWVLLECAATTGPLDELAHALDAAGVADRAVTAADGGGRERLLSIREAHTDAVAAAGLAHKLDVGVPLHRLDEFTARLDGVVAAGAGGHDQRLVVFGHLGDGNLHVNVLGAPADDDTIDQRVLELVARCGGTISAEHGLGVHKPRFLHLVRSPAELQAMRAVKRALDPSQILNPGVGL